jgi:C1A family cysteine protease
MPKHIYSLKITREKPELLANNMFQFIKRLPGAQLPDIVDLRTNPKMPAVYDQGNLGSCTAQALCAAYQFMDTNDFQGSRLFLYYNERKLDNNIPDDTGATLISGVKCLTKYGICPEESWPYDITQFATEPPISCYQSALKEVVLKARAIPNDRNTMRNVLNSGLPFVVGIQVYESFEANAVAATGVVPMPKPKDTLFGGHAVLVVGYNHTKQQWIVRNSWGEGWGDKGYFYLPYRYLLNPKLSSDMWVLTSIT